MIDHTVRVLNEISERYRTATDPCRKRVLLCRYLEHLQSVVWKAYPWSPFEGESPTCDLTPLNQLSEALLCLNNGELPELLRPLSKTGRKAIRQKQFSWANAAAVIDVLMARFEMSEEAAARAVARELVKRGLLFRSPHSESPPWKLLQTWRDKIRNGEKGPLARAWYDDALLFAPFYETKRELYDAILNPALLRWNHSPEKLHNRFSFCSVVGTIFAATISRLSAASSVLPGLHGGSRWQGSLWLTIAIKRWSA
jgi:hypothetical protein